MTKQESFKRRIRERMSKTGERYSAARRVLLEQSNSGSRRRIWVSEPEAGDDAVRKATGRGWDDWVDLIEAWPGKDEGHPAIAAHLAKVHKVDLWWSQSITGGYERIMGLRLPYQRPDGTFTAGKSKTITADGDELRVMLLDESARTDLFPGHHSELRSQPSAKAIRIAIGPGVAQFAVGPPEDGRVKVTVSHEQLPEYAMVDKWKFYWAEWLEALDDAAN